MHTQLVRIRMYLYPTTICCCHFSVQMEVLFHDAGRVTVCAFHHVTIQGSVTHHLPLVCNWCRDTSPLAKFEQMHTLMEFWVERPKVGQQACSVLCIVAVQ